MRGVRERRPHYLAANHSNEMPQQCIWFDTESRMTKEDLNPYQHLNVEYWDSHKDIQTAPGEKVYHWLRFGYACYMRKHRNGEWTDEKWLRFEDVTEFWDWVCSNVRQKIRLYLFCHNTSFDLPILDCFGELPKRGFGLLSAIIDAPPTILRFRRDSISIVVIDTLNLWRMPLKYLGKEIGLAKLDIPDNNDLQIDWERYGKRDVEILRTACLKWFDFLVSNDFGSFAPTLAGQSMRVYRHKYMSTPIFIDTNKGALDMSRKSYFGGRCDCFYIGHFTGNFAAWDVNSMYPYVMSVHTYPCKLQTFTRYGSLEDIRNWLPRACLTAKVLLRTSKPFAPIKRDGKLIFPVGTFVCRLQTEEIRYALENAEILEVMELSIYERASLFTGMVHDLYRLKQDAKLAGNGVEEFLYKKLLNSFYGKWGQSGGKWQSVENVGDLGCNTWLEYDAVTDTDIKHRQLAGLHQVKDENPESFESFPAIAAHITANARMYLWSLIERAGSDHVYYCDTDCLVCDTTGSDRLVSLIDEYELGKLKKVGEYDDIEIWGPKDYRFGSKEKHKGIRKDAIWEDDHTVVQASWSGLRGLLSSGVINRPVTATIRKEFKRCYDKGTVLSSGKVSPLVLDEREEVLQRRAR
jgi:DNA polymerase type B, organellar and viral